VTLRIIGIALLIAGVVLASLGVFGALRGPASAAIAEAMLRSVESPGFSFYSWLDRWKLWGVGIACAGAAISIGGIALVLGKRWGLLVVAFTLFVAALVPWIVQALRLARYPFESAEMPESIVCLALSTIAVWIYFHLRRVVPDA
jgi:hypothetical protein